MARVGTLEWANETEGRLTLLDRLALLAAQGVPTMIEEQVGRLWSRLGRAGRASVHAQGVDVHVPTSAIARAADELCETVAKPWLRAHSHRTYVIGALLGADLLLDSEMLFVASMLHDVGLCEAFEQGSDPGLVPGYARADAPCFAVRGADVARCLAIDHGWPPARSDALAEAITLHLNVRVPGSRGVEAHLLHAGTAFDVIRSRSHKLPPESVRQIENRWPRGDSFCRDLLTPWVRESRTHDECRGAFLNSRASFEHRVKGTCPTD